MLDSVRIRLTLWHVSVLAVLLIVFCVSVYALFSRNLYRRVDAVLGTLMDAAISQLADELKEEGDLTRAPAGALNELAYDKPVFAIYDSQGRLLAEKPLGAGRLAPLPPNAALPPREVYHYTLQAKRGQRSGMWRVAVQRVLFPRYQAAYLIAVSQSLDPLLAQLDTVRRTFAIAALLVLLLAGSGGWFLVRKSLAPVVAMSERARRISADNMTERLVVLNPRDELGLLAATFNELLDRLGAALSQQRQFMAEATHELRTPLSVIRTATSVTLDQQYRPESEYRSVLAMIDEQARHLGRIVDDTFRLARADVGRNNLQVASLYLDELLARPDVMPGCSAPPKASRWKCRRWLNPPSGAMKICCGRWF